MTSDGRQLIHGKKPLDNPDLIYVFVKLVELGRDEFYILRLRDLQNIILEGHSTWLASHGGRRPRSPESMHTAVSTEALARFRDRWDLITR